MQILGVTISASRAPMIQRRPSFKICFSSLFRSVLQGINASQTLRLAVNNSLQRKTNLYNEKSVHISCFNWLVLKQARPEMLRGNEMMRLLPGFPTEWTTCGGVLLSTKLQQCNAFCLLFASKNNGLWTGCRNKAYQTNQHFHFYTYRIIYISSTNIHSELQRPSHCQ